MMGSMRLCTLVVLAALVLVELGLAAPARADLLVVGRDGDTVQATIEAASEGDVVEVPEGVWQGPVRIDRRITLRGSGGVLDGGGEGTVLVVGAAGAIVEGLSIRGSGHDLGAPDCGIYTEPAASGVVIRDNEVSDCAFGIWIHTSRRAEVSGNRVLGRGDARVSDRGNGIHLFDADHLLVQGNTVSESRDGIYVSAIEDSLIANNHTNGQRYGIHYMFSYRNTLRGNESSDNVGGIALMQSRHLIVENNVANGNDRVGILFRDAQYCEIRGNRLADNGQGMFFFSSTDNVIEDNQLVHNEVGAKVWAGSLRNQVRGNSFIGNRQQIFYVGAEDLIWGAGGRGNYYSDYMGWDQDGDGVGERAHRVDSFTANLLFRYPSAVLLLRSPVMELLSHLEERMPLLSVPTVVDESPLVEGSS